jgi:heme/copper-type cytochrome/quinol oxidase subunit 2
MIYIIAITVYLLSIWLVWRYMRIAHSKGGRWGYSNTGVIELVFVFIPVVNTIMGTLLYLTISPKEKNNRAKNFNNFFKVKK